MMAVTTIMVTKTMVSNEEHF